MTVSSCAIAASAAVLLVLGFFSGTALAGPEIQLEKIAPKTVLYGEESQVELRVHNPKFLDEYGYNLSFRDVLPEGVSYVPGSSTVPPREIKEAPEPGKTTLIFENASDLSPGSTYMLRYRVSHDTELLEIGDEYTNQAGAYISDDPHFIPDFDEETGEPTGGDTDGEDEAEATTRISAIESRRASPAPRARSSAASTTTARSTR